MSASVVGYEQVFHSPLNTSTSKALYSFPRASRFKSGYQGICQQAFYDLPNQTSKRKAGIGYANKYDFTSSGRNSPAPNTYQIHAFTELSKQKNKGYSFGLGRDQLTLSQSSKKTPGPGTYEQKGQLSKTAYSMRVKTASFLSNTQKTPGPGAYEYLPTLNDKGRYTQSKFHNSGASIMNPPSSKRFGSNPYDRAVPGPGTYQPKNDMGNNGFYILSQYKSLIGKSFTHQNRTGSQQSGRQTPGPGQYRLPSDFGYYESQQKQ